MDVHWMQNFLGLAQACSNKPLNLDELEVDDDCLFEFSCPFCYREFDIGSLCSHLDDEHCFETRTVVCPVCAVRVSEVVNHITLQHGHLFRMQRRRRGRRPSSSSSTHSLDPFFSSLLSGLPIPEAESSEATSNAIPVTEDASVKSGLPGNQTLTSVESSDRAAKSLKKLEDAAIRSQFVQQLVLSMMLRED